jgi:hypothetical protein
MIYRGDECGEEKITYSINLPFLDLKKNNFDLTAIQGSERDGQDGRFPFK